MKKLSIATDGSILIQKNYKCTKKSAMAVLCVLTHISENAPAKPLLHPEK